MSKILILGGYGYTGKLLAKHLLAQTDVEIIISGRNLEKAKSFADELNNSRVTIKQVDASDFGGLKQALQGVTLCLVAAPTTHHTEAVIRACIEAHVDYLDIQFSSKKLKALYAAEEEINKAGLCFITEAGYHPGLLAVLIRYVALKLDVIESPTPKPWMNSWKVFLIIRRKSIKMAHGQNPPHGLRSLLILAKTSASAPAIPCSLKNYAPFRIYFQRSKKQDFISQAQTGLQISSSPRLFLLDSKLHQNADAIRLAG
jgi:hypothetical protein